MARHTLGRIHLIEIRPLKSVVGRGPFWVSGGLAAVAATSAAAMVFFPWILRGPAVMNGSARGTALVVLLVDIPMLLLAMWFAGRGSYRAPIVWLGAIAFLLYQSVLFLFSTPFNSLFLLYVALFALGFWSVATLVHEIHPDGFAQRISSAMPVRPIALYVFAVVFVNAALWLRSVIPSTLSSDTPMWLQGTGLTTSAVFVEDLAFWLPLMTVAAVWLWHRRPWGYLIVGSVLTMWVVESISIAVDQSFGHAADPASSVASTALVPGFVVLALVGLIPLYFYYRALPRRADR